MSGLEYLRRWHLRLEARLGAENGNNADFWLALQTAHDLWHARKRAPKKVRPVVAGVAA
jgi:plasmid maintenance system antidote protein VapI